MGKLYDDFREYLQRINRCDRAANLLYWDMKTATPRKGMDGMIEALTHYSSESFRLGTDARMGEFLEALSQPQEYAQLDETWQFIVTRMKKDYDRNKRIPADVYEAFVQAQAQSEAAWTDAKQASDYAAFAPHLQRMIDFTKEITAYTDPGVEIYDALLDQYEEGMDSATIDRLFAELREGLVPLVDRILAAPQPDDSAFTQYFDPDAQKKVQHLLLAYMGFDWEAGAAGETEHPFTMEFDSHDVRITNHYYAHLPLSSMFSAIHEGGHAIFEQHVNPAYDNTAAGSCRYMGIHESQSRFYENILGRNRNFWTPIYGRISGLLPQFAQIPLDDFYREINHVRNSTIRTEADEVTYCFHIMLRYEMEKAIFREDAKVADLPDLWNAKMQQYLHITPANDAEGILQDSHWSGGSFGYFPSYLLGSIYDGMFLDALEADLGSVDDLLAAGRIGDITHWLNTRIHWYGSTRTPKQVIAAVCDREVSAEPLLRYFTRKYTQVYHL